MGFNIVYLFKEDIQRPLNRQCDYIFQIITLQMKIQDSLLTQTTKQSLIRVNTLSKTSGEWIKVFIQVQNRIFSVSLEMGAISIQNLIEQAVKEFSTHFGLRLDSSPSAYSIYAARKNGKRYKDYPSLEQKQSILLTNLKSYMLVQRQSSAPAVYPLSQFKLNSSGQKIIQKKASKFSTCFCIF